MKMCCGCCVRFSPTTIVYNTLAPSYNSSRSMLIKPTTPSTTDACDTKKL